MSIAEICRELGLSSAEFLRTVDDAELALRAADAPGSQETQRRAMALLLEFAARALGIEERVYFLQAEDGGPIKIGYSRDVGKRVRTLQAGSSRRLRVLAMLPGGADTEARLHERYASLRCHGEWFVPAEPLLDHVRLLGGSPA